jgi:hypothetical protein
MATKGERFKSDTQREAHAKRAPHASHETAGKRAKERGRAKGRLPNPTSHNESARAAKKSAYELEPGTSPRPSRKSTRGSPNHIKTDSGLRITEMNRNASPKARAQRRGGNPS